MFKLPGTSFIPKLCSDNNVINIKALRKQNIPYVFLWAIYYAWAVAFTTWWTASAATGQVFDPNLRSIIQMINLSSSAAFVFIIRRNWFVMTSRIGAVIISVSMLMYLCITNSIIQLISVATIGVTLGFINISILIPFVFTLNNTEKFYSFVGSNVLLNALLLFQHGLMNNNRGLSVRVITFLLLIVALSATIFIKKNNVVTVNNEASDVPVMKARLHLTIFFNCILAILCKGAGKGILNITAELYGNTVHLWFYAGGLLGCIAFIIVYALSLRASIWLSNITFSTITMGLLCNAFAKELPMMALISAILLGIGSTIGIINMYYIIAVVGKKYNNIRYLRLSILFIGVCGGISGIVLGNLIDSSNTVQISIIASIISAAIMCVFLMISPIMSQAQFYNDWAKDSGYVEIDYAQHDIFQKYKLSNRETQVCRLLIEGYTLRQISAILSIAYSTVNTYCTTAYRKLNINSRTELIILYKDYVNSEK
jgi:DNA-binding CsgD family transcriptional regulator